MIVGRGNLDDVGTDDGQGAQRANHREELTARQPTRLGGTRARGVRRVENVDVDRDVDRTVTKPQPHPLDDPCQPIGLELVGGDDCEAEASVVLQILPAVQRATDTDVQARFEVDKTLLGCPTEGGSVGHRSTEVGVPGVEMGIEVQHRDRARALGYCPQ